MFSRLSTPFFFHYQGKDLTTRGEVSPAALPSGKLMSDALDIDVDAAGKVLGDRTDFVVIGIIGPQAQGLSAREGVVFFCSAMLSIVSSPPALPSLLPTRFRPTRTLTIFMVDARGHVRACGRGISDKPQFI